MQRIINLKNVQMSYNFRNRRIAEPVMEDEDEEGVFGDNPSEDEDHVSEDSEHSEYAGESDSLTDEEMEDVWENASLQQRVEDARSKPRGRRITKIRGKNGYTWSTSTPQRMSGRLSDVEPVFVAGPAGPAANLQTVEEFWNALFPKQILDIVVEHTNDEIERHCLNLIEQGRDLQSYHQHTDEEEMRAFIGILYYSGSWKSSHVNIEDLWKPETGICFYRSVMSRLRFVTLAACLRFDNKEKRNKDDVFSPIREIWEIFNSNCSSCYQPSRHCTVDEILLGFRGRSKFRMYIKSKPDKYGLKFFALNDPTTSYLINSLPYLGKIPITDKLKDEQLSEYYFRKVTEPIHGKKHTVTCDNWFTSVPLLQRMTEDPYQLLITGTIRKNKREIATDMKISSKNPPESKFFHSTDMTLVSYKPKKNKIVLVVSNVIQSTVMENEKSAIVLHYNKTKGGTDCFDWLCHSHTVSRRTNRWPMRVFMGMLDQAAVNARILLKCQEKNAGRSTKISAKSCLDQLVLHLVRPYLENRYTSTTLQTYLRINIAAILGKDRLAPSANPEIRQLPTQQRCRLCQSSADRKTKTQCQSCLRPMCSEHRAHICVDCTGEDLS